jgi:hypothetical protein
MEPDQVQLPTADAAPGQNKNCQHLTALSAAPLFSFANPGSRVSEWVSEWVIYSIPFRHTKSLYPDGTAIS